MIGGYSRDQRGGSGEGSSEEIQEPYAVLASEVNSDII